ncbi:MAG: sulfite exporter TauE/SafE family protein [Burkholderiales bacterium]|nr:sulfite exporter TauE/SafE family protein [Burkholderiales bacterium]
MSPLEVLTPGLLLWVVVVVAVAAWVYGVLGIGLPLIATPLLALVMPLQDAVIVLVVPVLVAIVVSIWSVPDFIGTLKRFWFMPVAAFVGAAIGAQLFIRAPQFPYALVLVGAIFMWLWLDWRGKSESAWMKRHVVASGALFGFAAGIFETTANVASPPLIAYYAGLGLAPVAMIQGFNLCFLPGKATQLVTFTLLGGVTMAQWAMTLPLAAVTVIAQRRGIRAREGVDPATYRNWLRLALGAMAVVILSQYAFGA